MKYYFLITAFILLGCNSNQQIAQKETEIKSDKCFVYPSVVDSLQIKDLYDSARWYVYAWHCDDKYLPKSDTSKSMTFGELPLEFYNFAYVHDTLRLNFSFMDKQKPILTSMLRDYKELVTGVGFDVKTRKKVCMLFSNGSLTIKGGPNRYENPLQPEVVAYIKSNWSKLDSCFRELAERKGIIK